MVLEMEVPHGFLVHLVEHAMFARSAMYGPTAPDCPTSEPNSAKTPGATSTVSPCLSTTSKDFVVVRFAHVPVLCADVVPSKLAIITPNNIATRKISGRVPMSTPIASFARVLTFTASQAHRRALVVFPPIGRSRTRTKSSS